MIGAGKVEETLSSIISMGLCLHRLKQCGPGQGIRNDLLHVQWNMHSTTLLLDLLREVRDGHKKGMVVPNMITKFITSKCLENLLNTKTLRAALLTGKTYGIPRSKILDTLALFSQSTR
jgi:hypothetical protein